MLWTLEIKKHECRKDDLREIDVYNICKGGGGLLLSKIYFCLQIKWLLKILK